jgi:Undecaprenyl-phosphate galactose phosphotransferase WbaP
MTTQNEYIRSTRLIKAGTTHYIRNRYYRRRMWALTLLSDLAGFAQAVFFVHLINTLLLHEPILLIDRQDLIMLGVCLALLITSRLYPGVGLNPAIEMKLVAQNLIIAGTIGAVAILVLQGDWLFHTVALMLILGIALITLLFSRWTVRWLAMRLGLWGEPVVIIGDAHGLDNLVSHFAKRLKLGVIPVMAVAPVADIFRLSQALSVTSLQKLLDSPEDHFRQQEIYTVLIQASVMNKVFNADRSNAIKRMFRRVIILSDLDVLDGAALSLHDFEGLVGIEAHKNRLSHTDAILKRAIDIGGALLLGLLSLPLWLLAMLLIRLSSPGPIFFTQERVGKDGRAIRIHKFRTMIPNADQILAGYLRQNPQAQADWERSQKLQNDPRIIRWGEFLRKFSLDELPQLFNVLKGEMSLVGPRPLPEYHHARISAKTCIIRNSVRPGLTGFWQVSGRSNNGSNELETLDTYYVNHWSLWLDLYILLRTVWVVLSRDGAY